MKYYAPRYLFRRYEILRRVKKASYFLEIGPGNLDLSKELMRFFQQGTLVDYNPAVQTVYDHSDPAFRQKTTLVVSDFSDELTLPTPQYDCIVACEVMEHIEDDAAFLQTAYGFLRDGGQLILSVPAKMKLWSSHDEIVGHVRRYEKVNLVNLFKKQGFRDVVVISYGIPFVNLLRLPRVFLAKMQYEQKAGWSQEKQSQESAFVKTGLLTKLTSLAINPVTTYPLSLISRLFNRLDWGNGYLVTAVRNRAVKNQAVN